MSAVSNDDSAEDWRGPEARGDARVELARTEDEIGQNEQVHAIPRHRRAAPAAISPPGLGDPTNAEARRPGNRPGAGCSLKLGLTT